MEDNKLNEEVVEETSKTEASKEEAKEKNPKEKKTKKSKEQVKIEALEAEIVKLSLELAKEKETYLTARADLENTRKRVNEQAIVDRKYAAMNVISDLVTPIDMLQKASSMETEDPQMKNFLIGFQMISNQLFDVLKRDGLVEIKALNEKFDPNSHHAVSKEHVDGVDPDTVIEVLQTGYRYKDRLVRPAMVKVSE